MIIKRDSVESFDFGGLEILDYTANKGTGSSLAVVRIPPGGKHQTAWSRRSDKYYYVLCGKVRFVVDETPYDLEKGDFCLVARGQRFSYRNETGETSSLLLVHSPSLDLEAEVFVQDQQTEFGR